MKYFYTDPLAAAWMAKHFGMEFQYQSDGILVNFPSEWLHEAIASKTFNDKAYIHPSSLHLLNFQKGDIEIDIPIGIQGAVRREIIQRNGIAFMWPQVEE